MMRPRAVCTDRVTGRTVSAAGRWQEVLADGGERYINQRVRRWSLASLLLIAAALAFACLPLAMALSCGATPKLVAPSVTVPEKPAGGWSAPFHPFFRGAAPATDAPPTELGKEAAKDSIANWAVWIGRVGYVVMGIGIAVAVFAALRGGLSLMRPLGVAGVGAACLFARFFLLAHGYFVSETISIGLIVVLFAAMAIGVWMLGHWLWERRTGIKLAKKAVARGVVGVDALAKLPVRQKTRSKLADAWTDFVADPPLSRFSPDLFARHNLPIPKSGG